MSVNPHAGTDLEEPWQQGFAAAFIAGADTLSAPSPLSPEAQDAYMEGVNAGLTANRAMAIPATGAPPGPNTWAEIFEIGEITGDVLYTIHHVREVQEMMKFGAGLAGAFTIFISVAIFGPDRSEPFFDEAAQQGMRRVKDQLVQAGAISADDNLELFMAACDLGGHGVGDTDELLRQGFWHGQVFLTFEAAQNEARQHGHSGHTQVVRFQTVTPDIVELIDVG
jgi:hypothetical protein